MEEILVNTVELKNGLTLEIFDASWKVAADRYKVILVARIGIDVSDTLAWADLADAVDAEEIKNRLPETVLFEQRNERFFVDEQDKDAVFGALSNACLKHAENYFSRKDFPAKFILKTFREAKPY